MCKAIDIAYYITSLIKPDNFKLQSLLYYCQGVHLARCDEPLFSDRLITYIYGFKIPNIFNKYKKISKSKLKNNLNISSKEIESIDLTLEYYGHLTSIELINRIHQSDIWKNYFYRDITVINEDIKTYFKNIIEFER